MCKKPDLKKQSDPLDSFRATVFCGNRDRLILTYHNHYDFLGFFRAIAATFTPDVDSSHALRISFLEDYDEFRITLSHQCYKDNVFRIDMSSSNLNSFCQYVVGDPINYTTEGVIIGCIRDEMTKAKGYACVSSCEKIHTIKPGDV